MQWRANSIILVVALLAIYGQFSLAQNVIGNARQGTAFWLTDITGSGAGCATMACLVPTAECSGSTSSITIAGNCLIVKRALNIPQTLAPPSGVTFVPIGGANGDQYQVKACDENGFLDGMIANGPSGGVCALSVVVTTGTATPGFPVTNQPGTAHVAAFSPPLNSFNGPNTYYQLLVVTGAVGATLQAYTSSCIQYYDWYGVGSCPTPITSSFQPSVNVASQLYSKLASGLDFA